MAVPTRVFWETRLQLVLSAPGADAAHASLDELGVDGPFEERHFGTKHGAQPTWMRLGPAGSAVWRASGTDLSHG